MRPCVHAGVNALVLITVMPGLVACDGAVVDPGHKVEMVVPEAEASTFKPIWGNRLRIEADVNGDGRNDTLIERFVDPATGKETNKFLEDASYDTLNARIWRMNPECSVRCSDTSVHDLPIRKGECFGLLWLRNEGDLNRDGREEIGWVGHWADYSNVNTYHIASWNAHEWLELASFNMWEWQLPDLPGTERDYALIGQTGLSVTDSSGTMADIRLVWPNDKRSIKVLGYADDADLDTMIIPLAGMRH